MSQNVTKYIGQARVHPRRVWFSGTTALKKGQGVCYDRVVAGQVGVETNGTAATDYAEIRDSVVALPSSSNNRNFAGVCAQDYSALTSGNGYSIEIYEPGSVCPVLCGASTTINSGMLTCSAGAGQADAGSSGSGDAGWFSQQGYGGRGSIIPLQTTPTPSTTSANGPILQSLGGTGSYVQSTGVLTDTGLLGNVAVGDLVVVLGGATSAGANASVVTGVYAVQVARSANTITLPTTICGAGLTATLTYYVVRGYYTVLAYLMTGCNGEEESGCVETISPIVNAACKSMVGGTTFVAGGVTFGAGAATFTLADGKRNMERKGFKLLAAFTTHGYAISPTHGVKLDRSTAITSSTLNAQNDRSDFVWFDQQWTLDANKGATIA